MRACQELRPWILGGPDSTQHPCREGASPGINALTSPPSHLLVSCLLSVGSQRAQACSSWPASRGSSRVEEAESVWIQRGRCWKKLLT